MVVYTKFGQRIEELLERLRSPERIAKFDSFVGSSAHEDLAAWFGDTADAAESVLPQDIRKLIEDRLREYLETGRLRKDITILLRRILSMPDPEVAIEKLFPTIARSAVDSTNVLDMQDLSINIVPIVSGMSRKMGIVKPDYKGPQWAFLASSGKLSRR